MSEEYKQRPDDHLVEPFLGGLGIEEKAHPEPSDELKPNALPPAGWFLRLLVRLGLRRP